MKEKEHLNHNINNHNPFENDIYSNNIDQYIIEEKLGEGIFGTVKLATHKLTKEKVAIKFLNKNKITKAQQTLLSRELSILKKLNHFNIIKLYSIIETESIMYLIQEYSQGKELSHYIQNHSKIDEKEICKFFQQIISGVEYIHKMGIAHRDLKPENILLTRANDIKIIDFGLSNIYSEGQLLKTSCGSPYYAPPEMLQGKPYNGLYSDIYSCGIILYYMLSKKLPFNENNNTELYKKIIDGKFNMPKNISKEAQDLLKKIIKVNPEERIKIKDIKEHPWLKLANIHYNMHSGLNCDEIVFPVDNDIVQNMNELGFNKMEVRYNIIKNEHNNITTTYHLLLDKKIKKGRKSIADLNSNLFDNYINDPKNKIENYKEGIEEAIKERINSKGIIKTIPDFELERKNKINKRRKSSIKQNIRTVSTGKEKKELSDKIKMKIKMDILNKKEKEKEKKNSSKVKINKKINIKKTNNNRQVFSAKIKNKNIEVKKNGSGSGPKPKPDIRPKTETKPENEIQNANNDIINNDNDNNIKKEENEEKVKNEENNDLNKNENENEKNIIKDVKDEKKENTEEVNINNNNNNENNQEIKINDNNEINNQNLNIINDKKDINQNNNNMIKENQNKPIESKKREIKTPEKIKTIKKKPIGGKNMSNKFSPKSNDKKIVKTQKKEVKKPPFLDQKNKTITSSTKKENKQIKKFNLNMKIKNKELNSSSKKKMIINKNKTIENKKPSGIGLPIKKNIKSIKK